MRVVLMAQKRLLATNHPLTRVKRKQLTPLVKLSSFRLRSSAPTDLVFAGTLTLGNRGEARFFGQTSRTEVGSVIS